MRAVLYRLRCLTKARWGAVLRLGLIVAMISSIAMACAAGARRTSTAPDRYVAANSQGFDAIVMQEGGRPRTAEVAALPGLAAVEAATFVFGGVLDPNTGAPLDVLMFAGSAIATGAQIAEGRAPEPHARDEFVATKGVVEAKGLSIGDAFDVVTLTQQQADEDGFDVGEPLGPTWSASLVGVLDGTTGLDDNFDLVVFSAAAIDDPQIALASTHMSIARKPGTAFADVRAQLDSLPDGATFVLEEDILVSDDVRTAVSAQARGLWLLAVVSALAAIVVLGQLITREIAVPLLERQPLSAVGFTRSQIVAESVGRAAVPIVSGSLLGAVPAVLASGLFPTGFVRGIEPTPGLDLDPVVIVPAVLLSIVALTCWVGFAFLLDMRAIAIDRPSNGIEVIATRVPTAAASTGVRFAFTRRRRDRGSVRAASAGLILTVSGLVGAVTFGVSLERLVDDPVRYGANYDISMYSGAQAIAPEASELLKTDPDVSAVTAFAMRQVRSDDTTVDLVGIEHVRGDLRPTVMVGRLPSSPDEVALGRLTSADLSADVGDDVVLESNGQTFRFRITGIAVIPGLGSNDGIGEGGVVTFAGMNRIDASAVPQGAMIDLRDGASAGTRDRIIAAIVGDESTRPFVPSAILNLARVRAIPYMLAAVLAVLTVVTVTHIMLTSQRHRRYDVAVLCALGANHAFIRRVMHWQATTFSAVPIVVGTCVGIVVGRLVFAALANAIGAMSDAVVPFSLLGLIALAGIVLSNATAAIAAARARRSPAVSLRSE